MNFVCRIIRHNHPKLIWDKDIDFMIVKCKRCGWKSVLVRPALEIEINE